MYSKHEKVLQEKPLKSSEEDRVAGPFMNGTSQIL